MSKKDGRDYLYLIWKEPISRRNYIVGELSKNSKYEFFYGHEVDEAMEKGFDLLIPFDDINKVYKNDTLFPTFSSRLPDSKRRGIEKILAKYGLKEFDEYELLKRSGARLPIDTLELIDPIFEENSGIVERDFYIAGVRHYIGCESNNCEKAHYVEVGDRLNFKLDPTNKFDNNAIKIMDKENNHIGFVPRYYSKSLTEYIKQEVKCECNVLEVNKDMNCQECIKIKMEVYINTETSFTRE